MNVMVKERKNDGTLVWRETCETCGRSFAARSPKAVYCSAACRMKAYRDRNEARVIHVDLRPGISGIVAEVDLNVDLPIGSRSELVVTVEDQDTNEETIRLVADGIARTLTMLGFQYDSLSFATDWFDGDQRSEVEKALESVGASTWAYRLHDDGTLEIVDK